MLCPDCGTIINDDAVICEYCGHEINKRISSEKSIPSTITTEGTLNSLKKALSIVRQVEETQKKEAELAKRRQEIDKKRQEILDDDMPGVLAFIYLLTIIAAGYFGASSEGVPGMIVAIVIAVIALGLIYAAYSSLTKNSRETNANAYYNSRIKQLEKEEKAHRKSVETLKKNTNIAGELSFLPEKYRNSEIISYLIQLFREKRVDNLKEALNLYEDDVHKYRMEEMQQKQLEELDSRLQCPRCGGRNCTLLTETTTKKDGYSVADGCCGLVLLGLPGLLCGACGSGEETKTKTYWVCQNCGNKFNA